MSKSKYDQATVIYPQVQPPICFYHAADLDGKCSGAIVKRFVPDVELRGYDYGWEFPLEDCVDRTVIMCDVSLPMHQMKLVRETAARFIWIDHHKSAQNDAEDHNFRCEGLIRMGMAACRLTWQYFTPPGTPEPRAVKMLGLYDVWDHSDPDVMPFQYGLRGVLSQGVDDPAWDILLSPPGFLPDRIVTSYIRRIIRDGGAILKYQTEAYKRVMENAYEREYKGYTALCVNTTHKSSQVFYSRYDPHRHHIMVPYCLLPSGNWSISFYTDHLDLDVSVIAKSLGGGGHKQAAGCVTPVLPSWIDPLPLTDD